MEEDATLEMPAVTERDGVAVVKIGLLVAAAVMAVALVAVVVVGLVEKNAPAPPLDPSASVPEGVTEGFGVKDGAEAPVEVIVYSDFLCSACKEFEDLNGPVMGELLAAGEITVEHRPLTFLDRATTNQYSSRATNAYLTVLSTVGPGPAEEFRQALYEQQPASGGEGISDADLIDMAVELGAERRVMELSQEALTYKDWMAVAGAVGKAAGVDRTPTVIVNNKVVENPFTGFEAAIAAESS